ncbi:hypothetical protein C6568_03805 [Melaminivora suipulveris]|uniref:Terminase small subunit n=1 Tax=Melaminivora suipulveris TaxID=2109913 RepID=A0A2R3Q9L1_9BURK|nr:hypothetical protein [Melaminivora suipulveris]AVO48482.1 hypothetical protein C6568_03805 [Melaminivora suipulveris]
MNISQKDMAAALQVSPALVSDYVRRGMPLESVEQARAWRSENVRVRTGAQAAPPGLAGGDYYASRALREAEEARLAQLKRMELEGQLIRLDAVRTVAAGVLASTREALLQLPARLASVAAAESCPVRVHQLIETEIHQALAHLAALPTRVVGGKSEGTDS